MLNRPFIQGALRLACATTPSLARCMFPAGDAGRILTYTFDPTVTDTSTVLHVTFKFRGGQGKQEEVEAPTQWGGETLHGVANLRALSERTADATASGNKSVRYLPIETSYSHMTL